MPPADRLATVSILRIKFRKNKSQVKQQTHVHEVI